jgi:glycosyltransferase involved in cell wall biosynthesis
MSAVDAAITAIIPVFNGERYIEAAIESVLRQTCGRFEIIVVDDGSSDQTAAAVARYGDLVHYEYQPNSGPSSARNRGIEMATGDFVAFLDADDLWHREKTAIQLARFSDKPELVGCASHARNFLSEDAAVAATSGESQSNLVILGSTLMARSSIFDAVGMLNVQYRHRDLQDIIVRADDRGLQVEILPDVLAQRRIHSTNMSHNRSGEDQLELVSITRARHARRRAGGL